MIKRKGKKTGRLRGLSRECSLAGSNKRNGRVVGKDNNEQRNFLENVGSRV